MKRTTKMFVENIGDVQFMPYGPNAFVFWFVAMLQYVVRQDKLQVCGVEVELRGPQ